MQPPRVVQQKAGGLGLTATTLVASAASSRVIDARAARAPVRAILFDAFPVFDPRPVAALAEAEFPGHRADLAALWRTCQFEYSWLRAIARDYVDSWQCTDDAPLRRRLIAPRPAGDVRACAEHRPRADV